MFSHRNTKQILCVPAKIRQQSWLFLPQTLSYLWFHIIQHGKAIRKSRPNEETQQMVSIWLQLFDHQLANTIRKTAQEINDRVKRHFWPWAQTLAKRSWPRIYRKWFGNEFKVLKNHKIVSPLNNNKKSPCFKNGWW